MKLCSNGIGGDPWMKSKSVGVLVSTELMFAKFRMTLFLGKNPSNEYLSRLFKMILMIILA